MSAADARTVTGLPSLVMAELDPATPIGTAAATSSRGIPNHRSPLRAGMAGSTSAMTGCANRGMDTLTADP